MEILYNLKKMGTHVATKSLALFSLCLFCVCSLAAQNVAKIGSTEYATLQAAVDAAYATTGDVTIEFMTDVEEHVLVLQKASLNLTIDGKNHTLTGQIVVDGVGRSSGTETLTITNINFLLAADQLTGGWKDADAFVCFPRTKSSGTPWYYGTTGTGDHFNYAHNVTVSNCTMDATGAATEMAGVKCPGQAAYNITIDNVTISNAHSLAQFTSSEGITITNCTATTNMYHGISVTGGNNHTVNISGNKITVYDDYGIRVKGDGIKNVTLSNDTVNAPNAIVLNNTTAGNTVDITSGQYIGTTSCITPGSNTDITTSGGTYSSDVTPDVPEGYRVVNNGNGTWTVELIVVARIGTTDYTTLNAAAAAVPAGTPTTITILQNLNFYDIAQSNIQNKTITFTGTPTDTLTLSDAAHPQTNASGADLTFENITLKNDQTADVYRGIIHVNKVTINNSEIIGFMMGYAETFICNNCTFTKTCKYHMWTYGSNCTFNGCTFNSYGNGDCKAINIYKEGDLSQPYRTVTFNDCAFNSIPDVTTLDNSAIQINSDKCCFVVYVNNCSVNGYINNTSSITGYPNLVNNKSTSVATTLYIDGVQILKQGSCDPVAKIDETYYNTLQAALDDAHANMTGDVTIELLKDITGEATINQKVGLNYTIDGNNHTLNGRIFVDGKRLYPSNDPGEVIITNMNFTFNDALSYGDATKGFVCNSTNNLSYAAHVTVSHCTFDGGGAANSMAAFRAPSNASIWDVTLDNLIVHDCHSLAQLTGTTGATITNDTVTNSENFVNISGGAGDFDISNCYFNGTGYAARLVGTSSAEANLSNNNFISSGKVLMLGKGGNYNPSGHINVVSGTYNGQISKETVAGSTAAFVFTGGTFNDPLDTVQKWCAPGYRAIPNDPDAEHCTVRSIYVVIYNANGGTGTMLNDTVMVSNPDVTVKECGFTREGYAFVRWNTKADGMGVNFTPGSPLTLTQDTTLYAQWGRVYNATQGTIYGDLQAAIDAASANDSLVVLTDITTNQIIEVTENLTINGGKHTITTTATRGLWVDAPDVTLKLKNFIMNGPNVDAPGNSRGIQVNESNVTLVMDSCRIFNVKHYAINIIGGVENITLAVTNSYIQGWSALNSYAANSTFTFDNDTLYGINPYDCDGNGSNNYGVIVLDGGTLAGVAGTETTTVDITNSVVIAKALGTCEERWASIQYGSSVATITVDDETEILDDINGEDASDIIYLSGVHNVITMPLADEVRDSLIANYFTVTDNENGTYTISHSVYYYWPSGSDFAGVYTDFHAPFTEGRLAAGEYVKLIENVSMTQNVAADIDGNFFLNFQNGAETHSITQNGYSIELGQGTSATTDLQAPSGLFTSTFGDVVEIHNSNDTYTYVVALTMVLDSTDVVCYGENNGTDTVKINGGMAPFRIVLSSSVLSQNDTVNTTERLHIYTGLKAGSYAVEIKDAHQTITGTFTINQPDTLVISNITLPDAPCPLMGVGEYTVSMTATGGNGGNVIVWSGDANDINDTITTVTPDADDRDRTYNVYVTVTDVKGCMATDTVSFSVSPVIADDETAHSNTTMAIADINFDIMYGCDTIIRDFGTPTFTFTNAAINEDILDTVYNNVSTVAPDSVFPIGTTVITWTAMDTCGHTVTIEQNVTIGFMPCPNAVDGNSIEYPSVRVGCYCWTTQNLRSTVYSDGSRAIPNVMQYPINTRSSVHGNLYDWYAAMDTVTNSVASIEEAYAAGTSIQGVCPAGWHIPTEAEVDNLMGAATPADMMSLDLWLPNVGTNATGLNILPSGCYNAELDRYERMYVSAYFWIMTPPTAVYHACEFGSACSSIELIPGSLKTGYSVRCVKSE